MLFDFAVQGAHWDNTQATLHPFVVYYKVGDELELTSICIMYLKHDTTTVHCFISTIIPRLKDLIPGLTYYGNSVFLCKF